MPSVLNSSVRGFCLLTESKPWKGQKTLPNYKYCSLFSGGVLLTFGLQFKREKKTRFSQSTVTANKINPRDTFTKKQKKKPRGHRI